MPHIRQILDTAERPHTELPLRRVRFDPSSGPSKSRNIPNIQHKAPVPHIVKPVIDFFINNTFFQIFQMSIFLHRNNHYFCLICLGYQSSNNSIFMSISFPARHRNAKCQYNVCPLMRVWQAQISFFILFFCCLVIERAKSARGKFRFFSENFYLFDSQELTDKFFYIFFAPPVKNASGRHRQSRFCFGEVVRRGSHIPLSAQLSHFLPPR